MELLSRLPFVGSDRPAGWTAADIPDVTAKTFVVTGANRGIGYEAARLIAANGGSVILTCRNEELGAAARAELNRAVPDADAELALLDLADLASVRAFAEAYLAEHDRLDVLINNAGVMALADRRETADGFELQFGTNHLGHFALTGLLLPALLNTDGARVVTVSSNAHKMGKIGFDDLQAERRYRRWDAYGQSKLANLLFTNELQRRAERAGVDLIAVACHPGWSATHLQEVAASSPIEQKLGKVANKLIAQSAADGALPTVRAATDPEAKGGQYFGPDGIGEIRGAATIVKPADAARDIHDMGVLWDKSAELTGVDYGALT